MRFGSAKIKKIREAFKNTIPVLMGYVVLGIGFGVLLSSKGYNFLWALLMCLVIYSGTMQYVAVDLISAPASLTMSALTALMMGARHVFYGISMAKKYEGAGIKKLYLIYALTDETYSLVCKSDDIEYDFYVSLLDHLYWTFGSVTGAVLGFIIPFNPKGIDFSLTALFITICVDQWLNNTDHKPALIGVAASVFSLIIFGRGNFLIPAMILIVIALFAIKNKND